jgi:hypothetical protein
MAYGFTPDERRFSSNFIESAGYVAKNLYPPSVFDRVHENMRCK